MKKKTNIRLENWKSNKSFRDIVVISLISLTVIFSAIYSPIRYYMTKLVLQNKWDFASLIIVLIVIATGLLIFSILRRTEWHKERRIRKDIEKRLYKNRAELQAVLDGVPDMIMQVDTNLRILWANKAALNYNPSAIGKTSGDAFSVIGESVVETYSKWSMVTGIIEKGIKYQPTTLDEDSGSYWEGIGIPLKSGDDSIYGAIAIARDVTERMRIEHSSNLLASIVESTNDAIYGMTFDSTIVSWNPGAEKTYGYISDEIIGEKGIITVLPQSRNIFLKKIEKVIREQVNETYETIRQRKNAEKIYVSITLCPFIDATGKKIGVSAIDRDITKRKIAENSLMESEKRYRELFENMSSGVIVFESEYQGRDFIIKDFNRGAEHSEELKKENVIGKRSSLILNEMNINEFNEILKRVYKSNQHENQILTIRDNDNKIIGWRDCFVYKLPSGEIVTIYDDITERIVAEESLRKSEEKFRTLVSTAPDGIALTNANGTIIEVNEAFVRIFEFKRNDVLGKSFSELFQGKKNKKKAMQILKYPEKHTNIEEKEIETTSLSGKSLFVELSIAQLIDDSNKINGMIAIIRDISGRKKYEYEIKDSREQLRNLAIHLQTAREEERKHIAFEIHDELGYALTALKLDLAWLVKKMNINDVKLTEKSKSMSELIETTINKVRSISTQLRPSILDHFGLVAAIEWQANEFQKRTALRCKLDIEPKDMKFDDPFSTAIFRIFQETLTNIARHAKASRVDVSLYKKNDVIELKVKDNGVGLNRAKISNHKSLGLLGIKERTKSLGGLVEFISENSEGTTVLLTVPVPNITKVEK